MVNICFPALAASHGLPCSGSTVNGMGDSITAGSLAGNISYFDIADVRPTYKANRAVSGSSGAQLTQNNALNAVLDTFSSTRCNPGVSIISFLFGYNDFSAGFTASNFISYMGAWIDARRSAGSKVLCITLLPSQDLAEPGYNAFRNTVNTTMVTWKQGGGGTFRCDGLADFAADVVMGPDNSPTVNPTYWNGLGPHPTSLGQQTLAAPFQSAIRALLP